MNKQKDKYLRKLLLVILNSLFFNLIGTSQNLVPNPSFEEYSICPDMSGQLEYALDWKNPDISNFSTPDLFHTCSSVMSIPECCNGSFQWPKTGNAYVGLYSYAKYMNNVREFCETKTLDSLRPNKCYFFSMYVNSANPSSYGINNLGVHFSENKIEGSSGQLVTNYTPQILAENIIYDTVNWVQIFGVYRPSITNTYITIGNFFDDTELDTFNFDGSLQPLSFYLIDDVSLYQLGNGYGGKDSTILLGSSIFLGQDVENLLSKWSILGGTEIANNVSGVLVSPTVTTTYVCEQNFCGEVMYDTITVTVVDDVGVEDLEENESRVSVYPNPSNGEFYISISENSSKNQLLEILDMGGKLIYSDNIRFENGSIKLIRSLESGIYVFKLTDEENKEQILKKVTISDTK